MYRNIFISILICLIGSFVGYVAIVFNIYAFFLYIELASFVSFLYGLNTLRLYPSSRLNFFLVTSHTILLSSSLGIINSYYSIEFYTDTTWIRLLESNNVTVYDIMYGQIYINIFSIVMNLLGIRLQKTGIIDTLYKRAVRVLENNQLNLYIIVILIIQSILVSSGDIIFGGASINNSDWVANPLTSISPLFAIMPIWLGYNMRFVTYKKAFHFKNILFIASLVVNLYYFFSNGRRMIFFFFILMIIGFFFDVSVDKKIIRKNIVLVGVVLVLAVQLSNLFNKFRLTKGYAYVQEYGIVETFLNLNNNDTDNFSKINMSNISTRTAYSSITTAFFVDLLMRTNKFLNGKILKNSILYSTPSNWFVDKNNYLIQERLYMNEYNINIEDISDSVYLEAMIDFGLLGTVIYPLFMYLVLYVFYKYTSSNDINSILIGSSICLLSLSMIETVIASFLSTIRIIIICVPFIFLLELLRNRIVKNK